MKIYAAYGSNMNIQQMKIRCPKANLLGTGTLEGYRLTFRGSGRGVANIEKLKGRTVPVVLWKITGRCENSLDIYEGYPRLYVKKDVEVVDSKGEKVKAFVYVMAEEYADKPALPSLQYLDTILQGYLDNGIDIYCLQAAASENLKEIDKRLHEMLNNNSGEN